MNRRIGLLAVILGLAGLLGLVIFGRREKPVVIRQPDVAQEATKPVDAAGTTSKPAILPSRGKLETSASNSVSAARLATLIAARQSSSLPATTPEFTNLPPETVLENLRSSFRSYQSMFRENPVGTNPEITRALDGGNRKQAHFMSEEDGLRINASGELIDPWGTPFFFHQLSGTEMEIHSAGPDRAMWTADDLVVR